MFPGFLDEAVTFLGTAAHAPPGPARRCPQPAGTEVQAPHGSAGPCLWAGPPTSPALPPAFPNSLWGPIPTLHGLNVLMHVDDTSSSPKSSAGMGHFGWACRVPPPQGHSPCGITNTGHSTATKHGGLENRSQSVPQKLLLLGIHLPVSRDKVFLATWTVPMGAGAPALGGATVPRGTHWRFSLFEGGALLLGPGCPSPSTQQEGRMRLSEWERTTAMRKSRKNSGHVRLHPQHLECRWPSPSLRGQDRKSRPWPRS